MNKPTMTLLEVRRALDEQNSDLQAAVRALTENSTQGPIALPVEALVSLREACGVRLAPSTPTKPTNGIRC